MKTIWIIVVNTLICLSAYGQKNDIQVGVGYAGADGTDINTVYDITYTRQLSRIFGAYFSYAMSAGEGSIPSDIYKNTRTIGSQNTAVDPVAKYEQWTSYSIGIEAKVVRYTGSTLSLLVGVRAQQQDRNYFSSSGSTPDRLKVYHLSSSLVGLELGIGYRRQLSEYLSVGGRIYAMPTDFLFGGGITASVAF